VTNDGSEVFIKIGNNFKIIIHLKELLYNMNNLYMCFCLFIRQAEKYLLLRHFSQKYCINLKGFVKEVGMTVQGAYWSPVKS